MTLGVLMTDIWDEGHSAQNPPAKTESLKGEHERRTDTEIVLYLYLNSRCFSEHRKQAAISSNLGMSSVRFLTGVSACVSTSGNRRVCCLRPEWARWQGGTQTDRNQQAETGKDRWEARPAGRSSERRRNALLATRARNLEQTASQRGAKRRERVSVWETPPPHTQIKGPC